MKRVSRAAAAAMCGAVAAFFATREACAGITPNSTSRLSIFHDPDVARTNDTTRSTLWIAAPRLEDIYPANPYLLDSAYPRKQPSSGQISNSEAVASLGQATTATTASFQLAPGTGVTQTDPEHTFVGASLLRFDVDLLWNVTSGGFGPLATGFASFTTGGTVGAGGSAEVHLEFNFEDTTSPTPKALRSPWKVDQIFGPGPMTASFTTSQILRLAGQPVGTLPANSQFRIRGFIEMRVSNDQAPSDFHPVLNVGAAPPTARFKAGASGDWSVAANWESVPAGEDGFVAIANGVDHRALFSDPAFAGRAVTLDQQVTLGTLDFSGNASYTFGATATNGLHFSVSQGNAVMNLRGQPAHQTIDAPVELLSPVEIVTTWTNELAINGKVSGSGDITKTGAGKLVLSSAANNFTGATTVKEGTLELGASGASGTGNINVSGVGVTAGGTLAGIGTIPGNVTIQSGGHLAPGRSGVGTISPNRLTLASGSTLDMEGDGSGFDRVNVGAINGLSLSGPATITVNNLGGVGIGDYTLIDYSGALSGNFANLTLSSGAPSGYAYSLVHDTLDTSIKLHVAANGPRWNVDASGQWTDPINWSSNPALPSIADNVTIDRPAGDYLISISSGTQNINSLYSTERIAITGGTLSIASSSQIQGSFNLTSGTLNGSGSVTVSGPMNWEGGLIGNDGKSLTLTANGGMNLTSGSSHDFYGATIINTAAAVWSAGQINSNGPSFNNTASATFDIQNDLFYRHTGGGAPPVFNNAGLLIKSGGAGVANLEFTLNNSGTVNVNSGTIRISGGGTSSGQFNVASGTTLEFTGQGHNLTATSTISGAGTVTFTGGTSTLGGTYNTTGLTNINGGTVTVNSATNTFSTLNLTSGTLNGSGSVTVSGPMNWEGGLIGNDGKSLTLTANGGMNLTSGTFHDFIGATINNTAAAVWSAGEIRSNGPVFNNTITGTFDIQNDLFYRHYGGGAPPTFNNAGTLTKSGGTGVANFAGYLNNSGTVNVNSGTLRLSGIGMSTSSGQFNVASGATLEFGGQGFGSEGHNLTPTSTISGPGTVAFTDGTVILGGTYSVTGPTNINGGTVSVTSATTTFSTLNLASGTLNGSGNVNVTGPMNWSDGVIGNDGKSLTVTASGGLNLTSGSFHDFIGATINNTAAAVWSAGEIRSNGPVFNNTITGTFDIQNDLFYRHYGGGAPPTFNNAGTLTKSGGTGVANFAGYLNNSGTVNVNSGTLQFNGPVYWTSGSIGGSSQVIINDLQLKGNLVAKTGSGSLVVQGTQTHDPGSILNISGGEVRLNSFSGTNLSILLTGSSKLTLGIDNRFHNLHISADDPGLQSIDLNSPPSAPPAAAAFRSLRVYADDPAAAKEELFAAIMHANGPGATDSTDGIYDSGLGAHLGSKIGLALFQEGSNSYILIRPTRIGDLNLDGTVTIADFIALASHFNQPGTWQEGDLNYDGQVTIADFIALASNFNQSYSGEAVPITPQDQQLLSSFAAAIGASAVPEPGSFALLGLLIPALARRSRLKAGKPAFIRAQ